MKNFSEVFEEFIKGQTVESEICFGYGQVSNNSDICGDGIAFENGYKLISYGGGCRGEDVNFQYIIKKIFLSQKT